MLGTPVLLCLPAECKTYGKTTWKGCGKHIDQVMAEIPKERQCNCPRE